MIDPDLPGAELVLRGLADLGAGRLSEDALLVAVGRPRLTDLGIVVPAGPEDPSSPEHALFRALQQRHGDDAHSAYNALIRRLVSFERALEGRRRRAR